MTTSLTVLLLIIGLSVAIVYLGTVRKGRWGINLQPTCGACGTPSPFFRKPSSIEQAVWGGWECEECGARVDKWRRPVSG